MIRIALADLRDSWISWLGVALAFVVTNATLVLSVILITTARSPTNSRLLGSDDSVLLTAYGIESIALCSLVGLAVVGASTSLVVTSRRAALARLALGGATPKQITGFLTAQVVIVSLLAGVVGAIVALLSAQPMIDIVSRDRGFAQVAAAVSPAAIIEVNLAFVALAVIGGLRQARAAGATPPVEALREAAAGNVRREGSVRSALRGVRFILIVGIIVAAFPGYRAAVPQLGDKALQTLLQIAFVSIPLTGLALATILPWICGGLTRLWTSALPVPGPAWRLARLTVVARSDRLVRSVVPIMFAVGMMFGLMCAIDTFVSALAGLGMDDLEGTSVTTMLTTLGLPLLVALAGSIGNIVMMARQRSAELALAGIVGATPRQQVLIPVLEAVILTVTASLLGLVMAVVSGALIVSGLDGQVPGARLSIPWAILGWTVLACLVVVILATVIPVLRSLRQSAPQVIARLVAA